MKNWGVHQFTWGTALKSSTGRWEKVFLAPTGVQIDVTHMNVILHENGIEFLSKDGELHETREQVRGIH